MAGVGEAEGTAREALMHAYLEAWNLHDPDAVVAFFSSDAVYDDRGAGAVARGQNQIRAHVAAVQAAFSDLRFELRRAAPGEDFTAGEWTATITPNGVVEGMH